MGVKKQFSAKHRREVWGYDVRFGTGCARKRRRKFGFSSKEAAQVALSNLRVRANEVAAGVRPADPAGPAVTVRELVERRAAQFQQTPRRRVTAGILQRWLRTLPPDLKVCELKTAHLQAYTEMRLAQVKPQSVFRELTDVCSALARAREVFPSLEDWIPPRRPRMRVPTGARDRVLTSDETTRLLAQMRRPRDPGETDAHYSVRLDAADLLQIALLTAARRSEVLALRWSDVNFEWGTLRIVGTKTDRVRSVPITPALATLLKQRKATSPASARVFYALARQSMLSGHTNVHYQEASEALGIPYGHNTPGGWVLHDTRHTAITAMLHAGASLESVMAISGHSARVMTMRYAHSNEATRRSAVAALDQFAA